MHKVLAQAESQVGLARSQPMPHLVPLAKPTTPADPKAQWQEMPGGKCMVKPPPPKLMPENQQAKKPTDVVDLENKDKEPPKEELQVVEKKGNKAK